ncbi:putative Gamma-interferon-inducible lysosomal thiol reductase [Melia azedarach]|uniref:Gamma-interferon-inducible lysosomal thiol reductase n=1 Tax=Melia azedarach TaxID=155640 RepID=A0ACC1WYQ2_MELAZ|nr:putative Gamma-interferon-inducible lysosomal thiol reductase [Melia azedarach]
MASYHLLSFVFSILLFIFISPSLSFNNAAAAPVKSQNVKVSLYYESLCPYCANFIENQLVKVFNTDLITIVNLRLVPYGNTQTIGPDKTIICQHGDKECYLNTIHACAIKAWPDEKMHFKLIQCIEGEASQSEQAEAAWRKCCDVLRFSEEPIDTCYESGEGRKLILKYANETDGLKPPHRFVPWVTVNDLALAEDFQNFIAYVCKAYKGKDLPNACRSRWQLQRSTVKETSVLRVCYEGEPRESKAFAAAKKVPKSLET